MAVAASRWWARPTTWDSVDSVNFTLGISNRFDLSRLQPHFPGYPVYVGLGAALHALGVPAFSAAVAVSAAAAGLNAVSLGMLAERLAGPRAILPVVLLHAVAWLPWLAGSAALSDSLGTALVATAFALLLARQPRPGLAGLVVGLALGARASYWPLALAVAGLAWAMPATRPEGVRRLGLGLAGGLLLWAVPFLKLVGLRAFVSLGAAHLSGHFGSWGGSILTRADVLERVRAFTRDLLLDGLAPAWPASVGIALLLLAAAWLGPKRPSARFARPLLWVLAPYAAWVFLAQNIGEQPRHVLPLVEGGLLLLGAVLSSTPVLLLPGVALALLVNVPLMQERRSVPAAGVQAAQWLARSRNPESSMLFAGPSSRYFQQMPGGWNVLSNASLPEALLLLSRVDRLPDAVLLTSDVEGYSAPGGAPALPAGWRVETGPTFCRDARIDRGQPCLRVDRLVWGAP